MSKEENIMAILIDNAIHLIAEGGFENATTKNLAFYREPPKDIKMNEVYIYRLFGSKEELYESAFLSLDKELTEMFCKAIATLSDLLIDTKKKLYQFFLMAWQSILKNEARCRYYVRYYYSIYFKGKSLEKHTKQFDLIVNNFNALFKKEANVKAIMHSVFNVLLDFTIQVYNGEIVDNEENRVHVFNVLYCMMMTYLKFPDTSSVNALLI